MDLSSWHISEENLWVVNVFLVVFGALLFDLIQRRIINRLIIKLEKTPNLWDDALFDSLRQPLSLLIWVVGISLAAEIVTHPADPYPQA